MSVDFSPQIDAAELRTRAEQATRVLREVLGASADIVKARWDVRQDDRGRMLVVLSLSDWTGSVSAEFAPDELGHTEHLRGRLYRLWGDLLQTRSHKQVRDLLSEVETVGA